MHISKIPVRYRKTTLFHTYKTHLHFTLLCF